MPDLVGHGKRASTGEAMSISYGCHVALELALNKAFEPTGLIFVGPADVRGASISSAIANVLADGLFEPPQMVPMVISDVLRIGINRCVELLKDMSEHPFFERLGELDAPVLFIRGEHDKLLSEEFMSEALKVLPSAELITIGSAAHCLTVSEPELISRIASDFALRNRRSQAA